MSILDRALRMGEAKKFKTYEQRVGRINLCADELAVQVKRHRDKRRKRRESRAAAAAPAEAPLTEAS